MKSVAAKILLYGILAVVVLIGIMTLLFAMFGENAIRVGIQTSGSSTLGVPVTVGSLSLSVLQGKVGIGGLVVGNPKGYTNKNLLELNDGRVDVGIKSLLSDAVHIEDIRLDGMNLVIEQKGLLNNLKDIINSLPKTEQEAAKAAKEGKPLVIDNLELSNIVVTVKLIDIPGKTGAVPLKLDTIRMQNLGTDNKMSMATLVSKILVAIAQGVSQQGVGILPDDVTNAVKSGLTDVLGQSEAILKQGTNILDKTKDAGGLLEGINGLIPKKKE